MGTQALPILRTPVGYFTFIEFYMQQVIWLAIAWIGGIAAILGSLMTIASLLLWLIPDSPLPKNASSDSATKSPAWVGRLKLTAVAVAIAFVGLSLLIAFPFPLQTLP